MVTLKKTFPQVLRHADGNIMGNIRIAVAVTSGPKADLYKVEVLPVGESNVQLIRYFVYYRRYCFIENIFKEPTQAGGFIKWSRLLAIEKRRLAQLLQQEVDVLKMIRPDRLVEVIDNGEDTPWIKLGGMSGEDDPYAEVFQLL